MLEIQPLLFVGILIVSAAASAALSAWITQRTADRAQAQHIACNEELHAQNALYRQQLGTIGEGWSAHNGVLLDQLNRATDRHTRSTALLAASKIPPEKIDQALNAPPTVPAFGPHLPRIPMRTPQQEADVAVARRHQVPPSPSARAG